MHFLEEVLEVGNSKNLRTPTENQKIIPSKGDQVASSSKRTTKKITKYTYCRHGFNRCWIAVRKYKGKIGNLIFFVLDCIASIHYQKLK